MPSNQKTSKAKPGSEPSEGPPIVGGVVVGLVQNENGQSLQVEAVNGTTIREVPTLLRQAAVHVEKRLIGE